ncbi:MAG: PAS domain S-box protein [Anaerolineaceae bacterium]|nr:PAS domain S-box protein [Anaerolineaceae bacterium]
MGTEDIKSNQQAPSTELFDHMLEGCQIIGFDWRYRYINDAAAAHARQAKADLLGRRIMDVYPGIEETSLFKTMAACMAARTPEKLLNEFIYPDQSNAWFELGIYPVGDGIFIMSQDISERKRAEDALRASESKYRALVENIPQRIFTKDKNLVYISCNENFARDLDIRPEECAGRTDFDFFSKELAEKYRAGDRRVLQSGQTEVIEERYFRQDQDAWVQTVKTPLLEKDGTVSGILGIFWDITERKRAESQLRESEQRYRGLFEHMIEGFAYCKMEYENDLPVDFTYLEINQKFEELTGLTNVIGKKVSEVIPGIQDSNPELFEVYGRVAATGNPERLETYLPEIGIWLSISVYSNKKDSFIAVFDNITGRKQAEEKLRQSERLYRAIGETIDYGVWVCAPDGRNIYASESFLKLVGLTQQQCSDFGWGDVLHPDDAERTLAAWKECVRTGGTWDIEHRYRGVDGKYHPILARGVPIRDEQGQITFWAGINLDISKQKQAEEALQKAHDELEQRVQERTQELSDLYNYAPCGYHSLDKDGLIVRINDTELDWLGYSRAELVGKVKIYELFTPASQQTFKENFPGFIERGWVKDLLFEMVRKDGSILPILLSGTTLKDAQGRYLMSRSTMIDYSERKQAEESIQKLNESLKRRSAELEISNKELEAFAYSVSHDLRTPLRAIDGFSRILLEDYADKLDAEGQRYLNVIRASTGKMDQLISDLLALSRVSRAELHLARIDMRLLASSIYAELASPEIQQKFVFSSSALPLAYGDPTLLRQVWSNLLSNAIKYTLPKDKPSIEVGGYFKDGMNIYYVKDNGVGFNPEYTHKLFGVFQRLHKNDEFEGTGVGLAIVQRILQRHGGQAWAEGKIGQGATIYFSIPVVENDYEL